MDRWEEQVNDAANATLPPLAHHSWYLGANVPGKLRVFMPCAGGMARYRRFAPTSLPSVTQVRAEPLRGRTTLRTI
jgi:hypothetical protein